MVERRSGTKYIFSEVDEDPERIVVSMITWKNSVYVATQKGIYRIGENDTMVRLKFVDKGVEEIRQGE